MNATDLRALLDRAARELPAGEIADAIGACAATQARLLARLTTTAPPATTAPAATAKQVAKALKVPVSQVYEQARQGRLPHVKVGKYVRFDFDEVRLALANGESSKTPSLRLRKPREKRSNGAASSAPESAATRLLPRAGAA